ncbi:acetyl-CoA C-acetyltransferase [Limosilactobacillus fastidiosus]|uniref:acetyl-CoA C-acetyltransferase n=1 Tax=Limosilactobacillus fastidiosus TaxID=2759855 RepID=A0A7W3YBB4_9LACO|nr:acetyl-CoA C-acetyltransferase [Limosilactobacillus fastidiosus]MBB1062549.1 acetyl-CoA C-acetyltransferase [Limosilactobacillus fastidiosus]MBB1085499.1 acetyl-CoA C-acetyltransferase [Limosilactobacillus fastidiosus]MCD7083623.1 acetyl-CoA C-acetyltransferase [Limosilactobacillus fastidiosus]MCD7085952.1 acetyl-CoA C-acetyltransferase [Limosilactobacillus fastidiosus]MCD7114404.1 acetyl-CoA C-acetyltransferase [Limosilactobacillus fastidiosus]
MEKVFIVAAQRTPIGKFFGTLSSKSAIELGAAVIKDAIEKATIPTDKVDQVLMGNVLQAGAGQNPARQSAMAAGLDQSIPAITINDVCGSGLSSITLGVSLIQSQQAQVIVAGGMESMSRAPYVLLNARQGYKFGNGELVDTMQNDALKDAWGGYAMGITAENVNERYQIARYQQDKFALRSHQKAIQAQQDHAFDDEITPVNVTVHHQDTEIDTDEAPRANTSLTALQGLKPAFKKDGSVTAGNASGLNDGAAAVVLASESAVKKYHLTPLVEWQASSTVGLDPAVMGLGPYYAISKLFNQTGLDKDAIDVYELNEAFAGQSIACEQLLKLDDNKVNPRGGAIALGHPVGCSGARIVVTLVHEMQDLGKQRGVASLCVGGGMGVAALMHLPE